MGDKALWLFASLRSMFLRIWVVFSQSLKAVVTPFKNFRWALPWVHVASAEAGGLYEGYDMLWLTFGIIPPVCTGLGIVKLAADPLVHYRISIFLHFIVMFGFGLPNALVIYSVQYWYRYMPFRLIGAKGRFKLEFIPVMILAAFHLLLEFNDGYLHLVVGLTSYFYLIAHFMHVAYDIGGKDVLLGLVMQVVAYILEGGLLVRGLGLSLCVVVCLYRYVMYCAPEVPKHNKKELEELPC